MFTSCVTALAQTPCERLTSLKLPSATITAAVAMPKGPYLPAGLPPDVTHAAMATLGGAVVAAEQLPAEVGTVLVGAAREAFLRGLVVSEVISGVGTLVLAVFARVTFRRVGVAAN